MLKILQLTGVMQTQLPAEGSDKVPTRTLELVQDVQQAEQQKQPRAIGEPHDLPDQL